MKESLSGASRADLHIHTMASDGTASVSQVLAHAEEVGLDIIAITDHDRIDAAQAAQQMALANGLHVQVIIGEEISTLQGHVLGLFLHERVRPPGHDVVGTAAVVADAARDAWATRLDVALALALRAQADAVGEVWCGHVSAPGSRGR